LRPLRRAGIPACEVRKRRRTALLCPHAKAHSDKLKQVALKIHDETDKIG